MRACCWVLGLWLVAAVQAQEPAPPAPAASAASAPEPAASAASAVLVPVPATLPELPLSCADATQRASRTDLQIARSARAPLAELVKLQDQALAQWRLAVERCEERARERAERLLADAQRARDRLAEREQAGAQCELSFSDALAMQALAKTASDDRRWTEAAALYRRTETFWDLAAEHCTGEQQQLAAKSREAAEIDAHNAEQCGPVFDRSLDLFARMRTLGDATPPAERERASQIAETSWREAIALCRGDASERAKAAAASVARQRGTPWVPTLPPGVGAATAARPSRGSGFATADGAPADNPGLLGRVAQAAGRAVQAVQGAVAPAATAAAAAPVSSVAAPALVAAQAASPSAARSEAAPAAPRPVAAATAVAVTSPATPAPVAAAQAPPVQPALPEGSVELRSTSARYVGRFALDDSQRVSGEGLVEWANGDRFEGRLVGGQRDGQGRFTWANGQQFEGGWVQDLPQGRGRLKYANGDVYEGQIEAGSPQGEGEMRYRSGDVFKGLFRQGSPHGRGLYRWASGQSFEGDWNGLTPQGRGVLKFANGNVYEGEVKNGVPEGQGKLRYANGGVYEGQLKGGVSHGQGRYVWPGGDRYEGAWVNGKKHGQGTFFFASGERWVGRFEDDERSDEGVFHGK